MTAEAKLSLTRLMPCSAWHCNARRWWTSWCRRHAWRPPHESRHHRHQLQLLQVAVSHALSADGYLIYSCTVRDFFERPHNARNE